MFILASKSCVKYQLILINQIKVNMVIFDWLNYFTHVGIKESRRGQSFYSTIVKLISQYLIFFNISFMLKWISYDEDKLTEIDMVICDWLKQSPVLRWKSCDKDKLVLTNFYWWEHVSCAHGICSYLFNLFSHATSLSTRGIVQIYIVIQSKNL